MNHSKISIYSLINIFTNDEYSITNVYEDIYSLKMNIALSSISLPDKSFLTNTLAMFPIRDKIEITIFDECLFSTMSEEEITDLLEQIEFNINDIDEKDIVTVQVKVYKHLGKDFCRSIYLIDKFIDIYENEGMEISLQRLNKVISESYKKDCSYLIFQVFDENFTTSIKTNSIYFIKDISEIYFNNNYDIRKDLIDKYNDNSNFINNTFPNLIPNDFHIEDKSIENVYPRIYNLFMKIKLLLSIIYLSNITKIEDGVIKININGLKTINYEFNMKNFKSFSIENISNVVEYYKIYEWVYSNNVISDEIDVTRNMISIHINKENDVFSIDENMYLSIQNAFEVYRKKNIKEYFNMIENILDKVDETKNKIKKNLQDFMKAFLNQILFSITYFITIIIFNSISSTGSTDKIFSGDIYYISIFLVTISAFFSVIVYAFYMAQWKKLKHEYEFGLLNRYKNYIGEKKLNSILDEENPFDHFLNSWGSLTFLFLVWLIIIACLGVLITNLS